MSSGIGNPAVPPQRLVSLDAFRGLTIAAMILVNNPGSWGTTYWPLLHAEWHGWTPTDLVFPFFLFIVGVAIVLALKRRVDAGDPAGAGIHHHLDQFFEQDRRISSMKCCPARPHHPEIPC